MRWVKFTAVDISRDESGIHVDRTPNVEINVDAVFTVLDTVIPSDIAGPGGAPIGTAASRIISTGGAMITVMGTRNKTMKLIKGEKAAIHGNAGAGDSTTKVLKLHTTESVEESNDRPN